MTAENVEKLLANLERIFSVNFVVKNIDSKLILLARKVSLKQRSFKYGDRFQSKMIRVRAVQLIRKHYPINKWKIIAEFDMVVKSCKL